MAIHYKRPKDGIYWVHIHVNLKEDFALGQVRNGHFRWLTKLNNDLVESLNGHIRIQDISLGNLIGQKIKMVKIEKPSLDILKEIS